MKHTYTTIPVQIILLILLAFMFTSSTATWQVTGTLVTQSDAPIADHQVFLYNSGDEQLASDRTDDQGRFTLTYQAEPTSADPGMGPDGPSEFKLGASYPNPFNPRTSVPFYAPENTNAVIAVYNILGQQVLRTQADVGAGSHEIVVNLGGSLSQGQYLLRVQGNGFSLTQSMTFVSAGIGGGNPEIRVRQGSRVSTRISGSMHQTTDTEMQYRIVVEETDLYHGKEVTIAPFENRDMGSLVLAPKEDNGNGSRDTDTEIVDVITSATGRIWMDRNLGASRAATSSTDTEAYGDLYQWGRGADGHQKRNSLTTTTLSSTDQPGHGSFITPPFHSPQDWRSPPNNGLWQGIDGINNPCPVGYRLPTEAEWDAERGSWGSNNTTGAFASPLKLLLAGGRSYELGSFFGVGREGIYWSGSVSDASARRLNFNSSNAGMFNLNRANGVSVRCIKDFIPESYALSLEVSPDDGGTVSGAGEYVEGAQVSITATANAGYSFVSWSGDTGHVANENAPSTTVTMPAGDITLTATFDEVWPRDTDTEIVDVITSATGRIWMDRNLGASRAATSSTDTQAYGDLYQWGRGADGHQKRNSSTTSTLSGSDQPGHGSFILASDDPLDWRSPQNDNLWQGVDGINNPCPVGYRLPTEAEWNAERGSWGSNNTAGAFASPLKLPLAGYRAERSGSLFGVSVVGYYWSSSVSGTRARYLDFRSSNAGMSSGNRAVGGSVRCIKDFIPENYALSLKVSPVVGGTVSGAGEYVEGAQVSVNATANAGYSFVSWSGDTGHVANENAPSTTVTMPAGDITLTATFDEILRDTDTEIVDVINSATGRIWMDRNLGASRAATSSFDTQAYGDLYQWGRGIDGHQKRNSRTTTTLSSTDQPGHGSFITPPFDSPQDWRSPQNDNLWQGVEGINNPCPVGYRLPTEAEWDAERRSWRNQNYVGAFASPLKLPLAGGRGYSSGFVYNVGFQGNYWSSSVSDTEAQFLLFSENNTFILILPRGYGFSVRCLYSRAAP